MLSGHHSLPRAVSPEPHVPGAPREWAPLLPPGLGALGGGSGPRERAGGDEGHRLSDGVGRAGQSSRGPLTLSAPSQDCSCWTFCRGSGEFPDQPPPCQVPNHASRWAGKGVLGAAPTGPRSWGWAPENPLPSPALLDRPLCRLPRLPGSPGSVDRQQVARHKYIPAVARDILMLNTFIVYLKFEFKQYPRTQRPRTPSRASWAPLSRVGPPPPGKLSRAGRPQEAEPDVVWLVLFRWALPGAEGAAHCPG